MRAALWFGFTVACHGNPAPAPPTPLGNAVVKPAARFTRFCPPLDLGPWAHELFPACQSPPLMALADLCEGKPCARPCGMTWNKIGGSITTTDLKSGEEYYTYDDAGRLVATERSSGSTSRCTYDARGRVARCDDHPIDVKRDPAERIVAIGEHAIAYDEFGRVVKVGDTSIHYDERDRIVRLGDTRVEWDGDRPVALRPNSSHATNFVYDDRDRLVDVDYESGKTHVGYDGDRIGGILTLYAHEGRSHTYHYTCKKPPPEEDGGDLLHP